MSKKTSGVAENVHAALLKDIDLLIEYGVTKEKQTTARKVVAKYHSDALGLAVLHEFYSVLPEAREEAVEKIFIADKQQGVLLFVVATLAHSYTVVSSENEVYILGEYPQDTLPRDLLDYFGYETHETFTRKCGSSLENLEEYQGSEEQSRCPVCGVSVGEDHLLGCAVEVCPWCDGQLTRCNCRFEKLDVEEFDDEAQLEEFATQLNAQGRIPFDHDQSPGYPGTSAGLDTAENQESSVTKDIK